jgi:peptidoglycan/LPS O-acetylase OafA/YrhL
MMTTQLTSSRRRYDLDWLRVFAILTIFLYHSSRFFNLGDWHVKNPVLYRSVENILVFAESWMMPLIFVISGASIYFAMSKGGAGRYVKDKLLRLGVPLLVAIFTHASLQVYLEKLTHGQFSGSYFDFLPHYFDGIYLDIGSQGNFAIFGMHLWYLLVLLIYSVAFYPLFRWLKGHGQKVLGRFGDFLSLPGVIYLLIVPTALFLDYVEQLPGGDTTPGGWHLLAYIPFLLGGFVIVSHQRLQARLQQMRWVSLAIWIAFSLVYYYLRVDPQYASLYDDLNGPLFCFMSWSLILAALGIAGRYLTFTNPFLKYANEAVLPFYILHQTVLLIIGYFVVQWQVPDFTKWVIIASTSFAIIMILYEFMVRRINVLRFLFGMKTLSKSPVTQPHLEPSHT